jgi:hypothetical protein
LKTDISNGNSELILSDIEEDTSMKNNEVVPKKHSSKSIFITEHDSLPNEINLDTFNEEDYLSWVSHSKGKIFIMIFSLLVK